VLPSSAAITREDGEVAREQDERPLRGQVAVVTGSSRGIGKGIALELGVAGATVYVTGRTVDDAASELPGTVGATASEVTALGGQGIAARCDHGDDAQVKALFERVRDEQGRLDILVNNAFTLPDEPIFDGKFWEHDVALWDRLIHVGCRGHYVASHAAVPIMIERKSGLIVNISSFAGAAYIFSVPYGVGKAAVDRMAKDMSVELRPYGITAVSLWPGVVRTEYLTRAHAAGEVPFSIEDGESPRFTGRGVVALASDPERLQRSGQVIPVIDLAAAYGFTDIDGRSPGPINVQMGLG
jgi:dehydrogenase/reductase SDR family protein 1